MSEHSPEPTSPAGSSWGQSQGHIPSPNVQATMTQMTSQLQTVIDAAVQLFGGDGVRKGFMVESLYREIRALRIYEGASDVQRVVIARQVLGAAT